MKIKNKINQIMRNIIIIKQNNNLIKKSIKNIHNLRHGIKEEEVE